MNEQGALLSTWTSHCSIRSQVHQSRRLFLRSDLFERVSTGIPLGIKPGFDCARIQLDRELRSDRSRKARRTRYKHCLRNPRQPIEQHCPASRGQQQQSQKLRGIHSQQSVQEIHPRSGERCKTDFRVRLRSMFRQRFQTRVRSRSVLLLRPAGADSE